MESHGRRWLPPGTRPPDRGEVDPDPAPEPEERAAASVWLTDTPARERHAEPSGAPAAAVRPPEDDREATRAAAGAADGRATDPPVAARRGRRGVVVPAAALAALGILLVAAVIVAIVEASSSHTVRSTSPRPALSPVPAQPTVAPKRGPVLHVSRNPFVANGVRFAVFVNPHQSWTAAVRGSAGPGQRWVLIEVLGRDLARQRVDPRRFHYRIGGANGTVYYPDPNIGTARYAHRQLPAQPDGALTATQLAFRVPQSTPGMDLLFEPTPNGGQTQGVAVE